MDGVEIPRYFLCPISLQIMEDPVTVSTGVSYDRASIDLWLTAYGHNTCPVTNQPLADQTLTPNSTLLRLIRSWAAVNKPLSAAAAGGGSEKPPLDASEIARELGGGGGVEGQLKALRKIKSSLQDDFHAMACMEKAGVITLVASLITKTKIPLPSPLLHDPFLVVNEATDVLHHLKPPARVLKQLAESRNGELISSLSLVLNRGSYRARIHASLLLKSILRVVDDVHKFELPRDLFDGVVEILKDQNLGRPTNLALLKIMAEVLPYRKNRARAIEAGAVALIVELLMEDDDDRRKCEAMLYILESACTTAEGRAALVGHPAGVAAVVGKVLRSSSAVTERAVRVLGLVCRYCRIAEEMMEVGGVAKLCMVVQVEGSRKSKEVAKEILGLHLETWRKMPCFPSYCLP
ncbi:E3 ubiquitin-protein ligase PUB23-like [Typha angustifolia]|uniref:E3 ubiquitin-protein ligase PUB23-like n=1 Tax=Typha angustifolia TaxID=59011 RepID=UPI003C3073F8